MAASGHVAFGGLAGGDVYDGSEEVGFPMLTTEILEQKRGVVSLEAFGTYWEEMGLWSTEEEVWGPGGGGRRKTYSRYDILVVAQMRFAVLAAVDDSPVKVLVVCESHLAFRARLLEQGVVMFGSE